MPELPLIERATRYGQSIAITDGDQSFTYADLHAASGRIAAALLNGSTDLNEARIAFLYPAGFDYVATQWGIWRAGGVAVPLSSTATEPELAHVLSDAGVQKILAPVSAHQRLEPLCQQLNISITALSADHDSPTASLPEIASARRAMMLYTSGTTSKPKGVVTTHANIRAQIESLVIAWEWTSEDRIPLFLPLHHIHGIINVTSCALWSGAKIDTFPAFDMPTILERCAAGRYSLFMAVPTIYVKLIQALETASPEECARWVAGFQSLRLMVSGSAALPTSVFQQWTELTGQQLLERYGMTEIGMAISNPLHGERRPGAVGLPLPMVEIRLKNEAGEIVLNEDEPGEIQVRGPNVFSEYWNQPTATRDSFDDGWFRTGDVAVKERGYYRILGRQSIDIIKSGGYKLSALEIEAALLEHPLIAECAVVGIADDTWGEAVAAAVVTRNHAALTIDELRSWCRDRLSKYKLPKQLLVVKSLPRNAMGKVTKPNVRLLFTESQ